MSEYLLQRQDVKGNYWYARLSSGKTRERLEWVHCPSMGTVKTYIDWREKLTQLRRSFADRRSEFIGIVIILKGVAVAKWVTPPPRPAPPLIH